MPIPRTDAEVPAKGRLSATNERRVFIATLIGTTVEWYDFFLYSAAASLVFGDLYFESAGPEVATLLSFASVGISFLFRPLGAIMAGHLGDRHGRRGVLTGTLVVMGLSTMLIGVLPTYAQIGVLAPLLLILLRILQGLSAGGEWGGAALMAVEHAHPSRRGMLGAAPQFGVPLGLLLSNAVLALMDVIAPGSAFYTWGWRLPFLLSAVLIVVGFFVRRHVEESPVFVELSARNRQNPSGTPFSDLFRRYPLRVLLAALLFAGSNAVGYMTTGGFIQKYATDPHGLINLARGPVLWVVASSAITWIVFTWIGALVSDRLGRRRAYVIGWVALFAAVLALFPLVDTANIWLLLMALMFLTFGLGFTNGSQPATYAELFPASLRFSGVSISYALGAILGGAFSPLISAQLIRVTGTSSSVIVYLSAMVLIGFTATLLLRDRTGIPLGPNDEHEQFLSPIYGVTRA